MSEHLSNFLQQQLTSEELPGLKLPTDRPRTTAQNYRGNSYSFKLTEELTQSLKALASSQDASLFTTLLAVFQTLLYRLCSQEDIMVVSPTIKRVMGQEDLIARTDDLDDQTLDWVNFVVWQANFSGNSTLADIVKEEKCQQFNSSDLSLSGVMLVWQPEELLVQATTKGTTQASQMGLEALSVDSLPRHAFDLTLIMVESSGELTALVKYNQELFDAATIIRWMGHFQTLLQGIVVNPQQPVAFLPLLTETERHQLLVSGNNTTKEYPQEKCIHQLFEEQVKRTPDAVAVLFKSQQLTYRELNAKANQLAHHLKTLGVEPEVLVGICVERSPLMVIGLLGILKAGGAYVPLDPAYPDERLAYTLSDSKVLVLLTQEKLANLLPVSAARVIYLDSDWHNISLRCEENPLTSVKTSNLAYIIYTSGSTGQPKGVMIEHRSVVNFTESVRAIYNITQKDRVLQFASIAFDWAVVEIFPCLSAGATLVLRTDDMLMSSSRFVQRCREWEVTIMDWPTSHWHQVMVELVAAEQTLPKSLRVVSVGGEAVKPETLKLWLRCVKGLVNPPQLLNGYGPTEATVVATYYDLSEFIVNNPSASSVPIGTPISNVTTYVLDSHLQLVPIGVPGELHIGGLGLARGYLGRPEATAEKFIPNPFSNQPSARLYKTGDLVRYLSDGSIEFLGRIDNQVKIRGFRIELGEIEAVIAQHPSVRETVVVAREDVPDRKYLAAYIVPNQSKVIVMRNLRGFLKEKLPDYMIPGAFVILDALPLTPNGKIDRKSLLASELRLELEQSFVAPRTPIEEVLAGIWVEVLRVEQVGIHDNFLELGGHSLLAIQVISRVRDTLGVELPLRSLFEAPTVMELAQYVDRQQNHKLLPPIQPVERNQNLPLSFGQEQLWIVDQLVSGIPVYNEPSTIRLPENVNVAALEKALNEIVKRHEILRTTYNIIDGQPMQVIAPSLTIPLPVVDLRSLRALEREVQALRLATLEARQPFDLTTGPLLRATLMQLEETDYRLFLTAHHIIEDGISSFSIFLPELQTLYRAFCAGKPSPLKKLPIQYADFAVWQRQCLQSEVLEPQIAYWKKQLADLPVLELPTSRSQRQSFAGYRQCLALSRKLSDELLALSRREGVTLFMTLLAAFKTLLYRYTGADDIPVGTVIGSRNRPELEGTLGFFLNTLVLRTDLSGNISFQQLLERVREVTLEADAQRDLPFKQLVQILQPERSLSCNTLFQVSFVLEPPMPALDSGWHMSQLDVDTGTAKFDLTLELDERPEGIIGRIEYNTDLFEDSTISRMIGHFQTLLEGIVANPQTRISELPLLTQVEQQLLVEWNNTTKDYPQDKCIHQLFEEQVERSPDAIAVVFEAEQLTYRELNQRANCLAHHLKTLGVGAEVLVGICVERSLEMVVGLLGILKAGGAYVPLDPAYPLERLAFMLEDASVSVLLTKARLVESLPQHQARVVCLDKDWEALASQSPKNPALGVMPKNLAYVIYTSGSTGKPKGVAVPHKAVNRLVFNTNYINLESKDVVAQVSNCSFDAATFEIWGALLNGAKLVVITLDVALSPQDFAAQLHEQGITVLLLTTALFNLLASVVPSAFSSVQHLLFGGETVELRWVKEVLKNDSPQRLLHVYGPTESTTFTTWYLVQDVPEEATTIPIGCPIANTQVYLLDEKLQPVPIGVPGELYIGGDGLAQGYLNRPDLTAEKFIPNPFSNQPSSRLYKTGDKARYLSDGNIEFLGRLDNQVKIRGFRIELGEIEAVIAQYPGVRETVVIAREDVPDHKYLVAYIVANHSVALASSDLRSFLKEKLPDYMIPGAFVMLDALPLTPNGKVDRKALPVPDIATQELQAESAPRTISEEILAQIWREVFHREFLSIHDNFFELGGDSILGIQIIYKANSAGLLLTPKQIFQHQTIADLAAVATTTKTLKAFQGLVTGSLPLTPIQHWFFTQNLREPHHFNQAFLLEVPPTLNPDLLQQALQQLLLHHDALRLRFNQSEACWQQFNALPDETVPLSRIDLSTLKEEALSQTIESTSDQLQASLNLNSGPLLRVALFHLGTQKPSRLLLVIHHLAVDGVSWRILLEDLQTVYKQLSSGKPIQLPAKTTSFKHWAEKLTEYAQSPAATKELTYWSNISTPKITRFPLDCNQGANTKASARSVKVSLNEKETRALLQEIHKAYHTQINDILLTALVQVLATWSGSNSILIDLEGHGREEILPDVDLSRTVGWFTTIFPMLLELKATENLPDAIKSIKEQLRAIPNRGIGYGVLRYLSEDASITSQLSSLPQAEVSFNYLGQFDWGMQSDAFFKLASESVGSEHSQLGQRSHLLEINGLVVENQLQLEWTYSENFHQRATIESLAQDFAASLRTLIAHCLSADTGGYIPDVSDVTIHSEAQQINNDQRRENNVPVPLHLLELPEEISKLLPLDTESAYPIAKMQEFMLHHYYNDHQKMGVYHCQLSYDIYDESLDLNAFKKALEISVQKHPALRTVFITYNRFPAVQVVKNNLIFSIHEQDISHIKSKEQSNYIDAVMKQDRQNLFDIENPNEPLFRFVIFHKAENRFEFLMSIHHAIIDGWSSIEFLNQLYELYSALKKGEEITVVAATNVYKEFVALEKEIIGSLSASNFWKLQLKDHRYKPLKPLSTSVEQVEAVTEEYNFGSEIIADLRELCRKLGVSPKALFLSTFLDLIGTMIKSNRVCVGIISNGRTERLSDPFVALGLFWNIVPFCQPITEDKGVQIKNVQQSLIDIEPYVRYPLLEILSDQQKPELFFATFNFVHFHNAKNIKADTGLKVNASRSHDKFNFPLNYAVSIESLSGNVSIRVEYDLMYFSCLEIRSMLQNYIEMVRACLQTC